MQMLSQCSRLFKSMSAVPRRYFQNSQQKKQFMNSGGKSPLSMLTECQQASLTPPKLVSYLNRFIIGQEQAKKAIAVAFRNRWRRRNVPEHIRGEISPKNMLIMGPTGSGKTEIARRLAKIVDAPFIRVEATKYTEVGYVGKEVSSIIQDTKGGHQLVSPEVREDPAEAQRPGSGRSIQPDPRGNDRGVDNERVAAPQEAVGPEEGALQRPGDHPAPRRFQVEAHARGVLIPPEGLDQTHQGTLQRALQLLLQQDQGELLQPRHQQARHEECRGGWHCFHRRNRQACHP